MEPIWTVRRAVSDDAWHIAAHGAFQPSDSGRRGTYEGWVRSRIESDAYLGWLATADGSVVAGAGVVLLDWGPTRSNPCGTMARVADVFTEPAWRRKGIARGLLGTVLAHCEGLGIREFNLGASPDAQALYASLGFQPYAAEMRRRVAG